MRDLLTNFPQQVFLWPRCSCFFRARADLRTQKDPCTMTGFLSPGSCAAGTKITKSSSVPKHTFVMDGLILFNHWMKVVPLYTCKFLGYSVETPVGREKSCLKNRIRLIFQLHLSYKEKYEIDFKWIHCSCIVHND